MDTIYACSILSAPLLRKASALHTTRHGVDVFVCSGMVFPRSCARSIFQFTV